MRLLFCLSTFLLIFISCQKKDESPSLANYTVSGATNFGKVRVGEHRIANVTIRNNLQTELAYGFSGLGNPFTLDGVSGGCNLVNIQAQSTCTLKIRFTPTQAIEYESTFIVLGTPLSLRGKGLKIGTLSLGMSQWNAGTFRAGELKTINVPVSNTGDTDLPIPKIATLGFSILTHNCGTEISPSENCQLSLGVQKATALEYVEDIQFYTTDSPLIYPLPFTGLVTPSSPSGAIEFQVGDLQIVSDTVSTTTISTKPIRDDFGNVVSDGEIVSSSLVNLNQDSPISLTTVDGIVSFTVRSTGTTGNSRLVLSSGLASGTYNISSVSGPPQGSITLKSYNTNLRADGLSTITLETNPLINISGNLVSNGTPLEVLVSGPGTLETSELYTVGGLLRFKIKSTTTSGAGVITIRANPQYDGLGNITGYLSYGEFPINFIPLDEIGNFDVTPELPSIYFARNGSGRVDQTIVRIENVRDENDNPVGLGYSASVVITNGINADNNQSVFSATTDSTSSVSFNVAGIGVRDWITIDVTINGKSNLARIFAVGEKEIYHNKGSTNKIILKSARSSSDFNINQLSLSDVKWKDVDVDYYSIRSQDSSYFGYRKSFGQWREIAGPHKQLIWDCLIPVLDYLGAPPCEEKKLSGSGYDYRSFSIYEIKTEREPETYINANVSVLPSYPTAFGVHSLGPISAFSKVKNSFYVFGGTLPVAVDVTIGMNTVTRYSFGSSISVLEWSDISLMAHAPFLNTSFTDDLKFPLAPSYYNYKNKIFVFGGLKKQVPSIIAGDALQIFEEGDLTNLTINAGIDGAPVGRYQNGVYYDPTLNELFIFGGRNTNGIFLDEVWKTNLSTRTWVKICNLCGLPDTTINNSSEIISMISVPVDMPTWQSVWEPMRAPLVIEDKDTGKKYFTAAYSTTLKEFNLATGSTTDVTDSEFLNFRGYGHLIHHQSLDRYYRHDIVQAGTSDTILYHKDGKKGDMTYYQAVIELDEEAKLYGQTIIPVVGAYSENITRRSSGYITEYGAEVYLWDYLTNRWSLVGENAVNSPNLMGAPAYDIAPELGSPNRYFSSDNKIHVLIKPKHVIGKQLGGDDFGENLLYINHIYLKGVF